MTVTTYDFDLLFLGLVYSKPTIASSMFSLMLLSIYPLSFKYLRAFKLYICFNYDKCSFLKFLLSIRGPEVDVSSSKIDPSTSSPVRSLKVAFMCFV